jgi:hypothetical protein
MKRGVSVVRFKFRCNILISGKIIKEIPGPVASGTPCSTQAFQLRIFKNSLKTGGKGTFGQCRRQCEELKRGLNLIGPGNPSMTRSVGHLK